MKIFILSIIFLISIIPTLASSDTPYCFLSSMRNQAGQIGVGIKTLSIKNNSTETEVLDLKGFGPEYYSKSLNGKEESESETLNKTRAAWELKLKTLATRGECQ